MKRSFLKFTQRLTVVDLRAEVEKRALTSHVSLLALYEGADRAPSNIAARRDVYTWLMKKGFGNNEIARLFDRAPSGVSKLINGGK